MKVTEEEKKLLQAKHRLEEAQMRDRVRERKARTRRLIQEGAVFEKHFPAARHMELLRGSLRGGDCGCAFRIFTATISIFDRKD